jgi:hypothetical protein
MSYSGEMKYVFFLMKSRFDYEHIRQIEYMVVWFDDEEKNAKLSLRQSEILAVLHQVELDLAKPGAMNGEEM